MSDFLTLELGQGYPAPRIGDILASAKDSSNLMFYNAANRIRYLQKPNPIYTLVAVRDLIQMSPLGSENPIPSEEYSPERSFKWLYLLAAMTTTKIQAEDSMIEARNKYVFSKIRDSLLKLDLSSPQVLGYVVGVLCLAARLVSDLQYTPDELVTADFTKFLTKLLKETPSGKLEIKERDFQDPNLCEYLYPCPMEREPFSDIQTLLKKACLRLILRIGSKIEEKSELKSLLLELSSDVEYSTLAIFALASILCGDISEAHKYVDKEMYSSLSSKILSSPKVPSLYSEWVELSLTLSKLATTAVKRPEPWKEYASTNKPLMDFLFIILMSNGDESILARCAQLIRLGPEPLPDTRDLLKLMSNTRPGLLYDELALILKNSSLTDIIHDVLPLASKRGSNSKHIISFLSGAIPGHLLESAVRDALESSLSSIRTHPDYDFYSEIAKYVKLNAAVFPREPCPTCCSSHPVYQSYQVRISRQTAKFTHDTITVKLPNAVQFSEMNILISPKKYRKLARKATVTFSGETIQNINQLDTASFSEPIVFQFQKDSSRSTIKLTLPVYATALRITFSDFIYDNTQPLNCISCRNKVTDIRSGVCSNCRENVYACRECRHINYNFLDGFICRECGFSSDASYEITGMAAPAFEFTRVSNANERTQALAALDTVAGEGSTTFNTLENLKESISKALNESDGHTLKETSNLIDDIYTKQAKQHYSTFVQKIAHISEIRKALNAPQFPRETVLGCFECNMRFAKSCITALNKDSLSLLISLERDPIFGRSARKQIVKISKEHPETTEVLVKNASSLTLVDVVNIPDIHQGQRASVLVASGNQMVLNAIASTKFITNYDLYATYLAWRHISIPQFWIKIPEDTKLSLLLHSSKGTREVACSFFTAIARENIIGAVKLINKTLKSVNMLDDTFLELLMFANNLTNLPRTQTLMIYTGTLDTALTHLHLQSMNQDETLTHGKILDSLSALISSLFPESIIPKFALKTPSRISLLSLSLFNVLTQKSMKTRFIQTSIQTLQTIVSLTAASGQLAKSLIFDAGIRSIPLGSPVCHTLVETLFPSEKPSDTLILMKKCRNQEDFIPGQLTREPVPSAEIGLLMRDIKNRVCTELGMDSLLEDDRGVELLVANNIVALDLKISDVANHLWNPQNPGQPMEVVFRVQGLSGEATENMVTSFQSSTQEMDLIEYVAFAKQACETGALDVLLNAMDNEPSDVSILLQKLFTYFYTLDSEKVSRVLVRQLEKGFDSEDSEHIIRILNLLKGYIKESEGEVILSLLARAEDQGKENVIPPLLALLPSLSFSPSLRDRTLRFFLDGEEDVLSDSHLANSFGDFMMLLPAGSSGDGVRGEVMSRGIFQEAVDKLSNGEVTPSVLKTLAGTVLGYEPAQRLMLEGNRIELLMEVEKEVSEDSRGELALKVLENLTQSPSICAEAIEQLRSNSIEKKKERAKKGKMQALEKFVIPEGLLGFLEEEEQGFECCVCKEGNLEDMNFYAFIRQTKQGSIMSTHFTCIHRKCHEKATTIERKHLSEWEAAKVRNCERVCNTLFPVPEGKQKREEYILRVSDIFSKHFGIDRQANSILNNISAFVRLLSKSEAYPFEFGGGSLSNQSAVIPYLVYTLSLLLDSRRSNRQTLIQSLKHSLEKGTEIETALAISLVLSTLSEWSDVKSKILGFVMKMLPEEEGMCMLRQLVIYDRMQKMMKTSDQGIEDFLETLENSGKEVIGKWQTFGDGVSHELSSVQEAEKLLSMIE